ncbi:PLP-dependent aminotransferase family protein [Planctomicrobium sp. SH661]|uniref:aminotransferase-like domain-containing protein n=1 Tax=Planctomicrobium sp. SH661 TaxID=3448124 RepID=UPI003F5C2E93
MPDIHFSQRRAYTKDLAISFLMQQGVENPQVISLAAGLVDPETLPLGEVLQAAAAIFASPAAGKGALQYGTTPGYLRLRRMLLEHLARLEHVDTGALGVDADQLLLTTGSQQLLSLVCEVLFDPGDICLVAGPTYFVFAGNLEGVGARAITIPSDQDGMRTDVLEETLQQLHAAGELPRVKMIYVVSYYDNPGGTCLSLERRQQLVDIARRWSHDHRILILEDAAYRELRYDGDEFPSVWSLDETRQQVIYTQTFSKTFSPGIRVGFGIVPTELIGPLCDRKGNEDFGSSNFAQHLIATVLQQGMYEPHLQQVRLGYQTKRDAMLAAAQNYFGDLPGVTWHHPHGGLYVWMTLPESIATGFESDLFRAAVAEGVMYVPGEICYAEAGPSRRHNQMRLSFGVQTSAGIDQGMQRLATAVRAMLKVG